MFMEEKNQKSFMDMMHSGWKWVYKLRSLILAVPVAVAAVFLAIRNASLLPELVILDLAKSKGGNLIFQSLTIGRNTAVIFPLVLTALCLLLMFCSKKVVYPWLISLFSLVLPVALLWINTFP